MRALSATCRKSTGICKENLILSQEILSLINFLFVQRGCTLLQEESNPEEENVKTFKGISVYFLKIPKSKECGFLLYLGIVEDAF